MDGASADRVERKTCATCLAFNALKRECRRSSPVMVPIPQQDALGRITGFNAAGLYPATSVDDWCAQHLDEYSHPTNVAMRNLLAS